MIRISLIILALISINPDMAAAADAGSKLSGVTLEGGQYKTYEQLLSERGLTGLSVAVVDGFEVVYTEVAGYREVNSNNRVNRDTAFSTASISKAITGTLAVMLAEQQVLDLDAPVTSYLKRWHLPDALAVTHSAVTLRQLLSHTAGTSQGGFADFYQGDAIPTLIDSLNGVGVPNYRKPIAALFAPGTDFEYSGGGYGIVQIALEDVTGKPLAQLAEEMLFEPLGMKNTTMYQHGHDKFLENVAKVHDRQQKIIGTGIPICPQTSASGMWSTATDMAIFMIEFQKALAARKTTVISHWVAEESTRIHTVKKLGGWGLGWMRNEAHGNLDWFSHGGANTGTGGHILSTMEGGRAIIIFGNGPNRIRQPIINMIVTSIVKTMDWHQPIKDYSSKPDDALLARMSGRYLTPFEEVVRLSPKVGKLVMRFTNANGKDRELVFVGNDRFEMDGHNSQISIGMSPEDHKEYLIYFRKGTELHSYAMRKLSQDEILPNEIARTGTFEATQIAYKAWQDQYPQTGLLRPSVINNAGYAELAKKNYMGALNFFQLNVSRHPENAIGYDSLAEGYMMKGDKKLATKFYKKSLSLDPGNDNAKRMLAQLTGQPKP